MSRHGDRRGQITDFRGSFETINWQYLLFKCGIKTKTYFEWLLWHWSSLGQLYLKPTRPNGLVGCKVPTDLVKISIKEATHGFLLYSSIIHGIGCWHAHSQMFKKRTRPTYFCISSYCMWRLILSYFPPENALRRVTAAHEMSANLQQNIFKIINWRPNLHNGEFCL